MKKIGIVTICDYNNYGNRLQNYAVQEVLTGLNFNVETIVNSPGTGFSATMKRHFGRSHNMSLAEFLIRSIKKSVRYAGRRLLASDKSVNARRAAFRRWTSEYIRETSFCVTRTNLPRDLSDSYDFFVVGSDQVWNPLFRNGFEVDFLTFAPPQKRIAYAASFGVNHIPIEYIDAYTRWLSEMHFLSVREEAGARIIATLTGRDDALVLLDPTLMLPKEKWLRLARSASAKPQRGYLLTYTLGKVSKERKALIHRLADDHGLEIVNMACNRDKERFVADPSEFIDYINSASLVLTDSFHGTIFSILLEKPFVVLDREGAGFNMGSRFDTLLSIFDFEHRRWPVDESELLDVDFSHVEAILQRERKKTYDYLRQALALSS